MTNCKRITGRWSDLIATSSGRMGINAAIRLQFLTYLKVKLTKLPTMLMNTQHKQSITYELHACTQCGNIWTSELTDSCTFLEIHFLPIHTYRFFFLFIVSTRQEMCSIYTGNWSFILTFVKLWEAEITGLARSQTFPGAGIMKQRFRLVWNKKSPPYFFLFLHLQGKIGWLFSTALLGLMNDMHHRVDEMWKCLLQTSTKC